MRNIHVVPYNPSWAEAFEQIKIDLESVLKGTVLAIEHVGSTSVPGLFAKPIIDIDVIIAKEMFNKVEERLRLIRPVLKPKFEVINPTNKGYPQQVF